MEKLNINDVKQDSNISNLLKLVDKYYNTIEVPFLNSNPYIKELSLSKYFSYGTAGFRMKAKDMDLIALRIAIVLYLRSLNLSLPIGVVISASHNTHEDNGFKIADLKGKMPDKEWEKISEKIINSKDLITDITSVINEKVEVYLPDTAKIIIGYDTRQSSPYLYSLIKKTLDCFGCEYVNYEETTTPQLHFLTFLAQSQLLEGKKYSALTKTNKKYYSALSQERLDNNSKIVFPKTLYFDILKEGAFKSFCEIGEKLKLINMEDYKDNNRYEDKLLIDCGNGIGGSPDNRCGIKKILSGFCDIEVSHSYIIFALLIYKILKLIFTLVY